MNIREMRQAYMPDRIRLLLVAEAPRESTDRFFYNPVVATHDSLFLETSKVLLPEVWKARGAKDVRAMKTEVLARLCDEGVYLVDAVDERLPQGLSDARCAAILREHAATKVAEIVRLLGERGAPEASVVLIKGTVFDALAEGLRAAGVRVPQERPLPFPSSGQQVSFRESLVRLLG